MLLAALLDAGADLTAVQGAVDAVVPAAIDLTVEEVSRAGLRALYLRPQISSTEPGYHTWRSLRRRLNAAPLAGPVRAAALRVFTRLAESEARVHGVSPEDAHFHETGALDSVADVVGVCAALHDLDVGDLRVGTIALGSGRVHGSHGDLPVPTPAVLDLTCGWSVRAGGEGELATPTGVALLTALAAQRVLPDMTIRAVGVGAGTRDPAERANVVRVVLGSPAVPPESQAAVVLESNVDDLDPRVWPTLLKDLLDLGADDAWLVPILMKKGRPAHTLHVLCSAASATALREVMFTHTTTIGLRQRAVDKFALPRAVSQVSVRNSRIRIKIALRNGRIINAMPEFDDVAATARSAGVPVSRVLAEAGAAAHAAGLVAGESWTAS
ncbi:nickel pincer cofactor biosynthesis protein LarC [Streptomyces sp. SID5474]|nr:nickel pincer cofactor biosynthesis protein LarC [Streptomyces sp. SID5474]